LDQEVSLLLNKGAIEEIQPITPGFYSSMFVIPKKNGGSRPVFNLKKLNNYIQAPHFKMETLQEVTKQIRQNNYLTSIDLSDAFLHIPVHVDSRPYLRLNWKGKTYQFCTTPFGLSLVPWLFTKLTKPILEWARSQQIRLSAYLDDWIIISDSATQATQHTQLVVQKLESLGWIINYSKSILKPQQSMEHLGFLLDTTTMTAQLPGKKLRDLRRSIQQILKNPLQSPRTIHSLTMRIQAATFALIPARLYTQHLLRMKNQTVRSSDDWDKPQRLTVECIQELTWWKNNITHWNGKSILPQTPQQTIYVDASNQWMGMQLTTEQQQTPNRIWTLDSPRSTNVDQLERTQSSISRFEDLSKTTEHAHSYPNGQYNVHGIYEQAGWNPVPSPDGIGNSVMEMVSSTRNNHSIQPYLWDRQHHRRLRVSPPISEEQLDDRSCNLHSSPTPSGSKRRRSICRQDNETTSKIRVLAPQSRKLIYRRLYNPLESISTSILEPAMELDQSMPSEDYSGETSASHYDNTLVAQRALVPDNSVPEHQFTFTAPPVGYCPPITNLDLANDKQYLETRRLELIRSKYQQSDLNENAQAIFINRRIQDSSTNKSYKPGQLLFLKWCIEKQISQQFFTPADLINFLSDMYTNHSYAISTIQLFRAAVTNLHYNPSSIREDERLNSFITTLLGHAPPTRLHRPTVSLQPTVDHLMTLDNKTITLATLQSKLAFLLGVTCFLRPSDLHRIPLSSVSVSADSNLSFEVHCPKEKRQRRRIIKSFQVKAHIDPRLCPVHTFQLFHHRRPTCQATTLFINSLQPNKLISARTIQSWISKLIHRSTHEKRVSLRSIASSLALQSGIPKEDIITMGNWASSTTFENHYRREHLSTFDFTNTLIISDDTYGDDSQDEDIFYDADDNMDSI
jgi:hypothetical protein